MDLEDGRLFHGGRSRGEVPEVHLALVFLAGEIGFSEGVAESGVHPDISLAARN